MPLKITPSCEIDDLIDEIGSISGQSYDTIESVLMDTYIYPETRKTFLMKDSKTGQILCSIPKGLEWLEDSLQTIFSTADVSKLYVTIAI